MEHKKTSRKTMSTMLVIFVALGLSGCYYDNEEYLYPSTEPCFWEAVSYADEIEPILDQHCTGCHSGASASAGISLEAYDQVFIQVDNTVLYCTINHLDDCSPMPQNAEQLDPCTISAINTWIAEGASNN